jgi:phosphotransferase system  glucose/maltose/N-acetylglucosamine-specific IIC component
MGVPEPAIAGVSFFLIWLFMIVMIVGWIILLVVIWRGLRAHESIAESLRQIASKYSEGEIPR